jgi:hypothetical protein
MNVLGYYFMDWKDLELVLIYYYIIHFVALKVITKRYDFFISRVIFYILYRLHCNVYYYFCTKVCAKYDFKIQLNVADGFVVNTVCYIT